MALITAPTLGLKSIQWTIDRPAQGNAGWSGKRTIDEPLYGKWFANVELATIDGEANFAPVRSFLFRCEGTVNTFHLPATIEAQNSNTGVTVSTDAAVGDTTLALSGVTTDLAEGQMVTVNGQLLQLTEDQSGSTITFEPPLREAAPSGTAVETAEPYAVVRMASPEVAWTVTAPARFGAAFDVEEDVGA